MLDYSTFSYFLLHNGFKLQEIKGSERGGGGEHNLCTKKEGKTRNPSAGGSERECRGAGQ